MEKKAAAKKNVNNSPKKKSEKAVPKTGSEEKSSPKKDFLVVGLGASAGGVKALQEFFATMPPNSGMAFVVILHLSPQHESNLAPILQAQTTMPVIQVNETHKVEPNRVYVIPPNGQLEMADGTVRCEPPEKKAGTRVAIDVFFRTLAEAYERNAVCVVMSGTGSDGTLGLKRVKESNGFAIVQSPDDAEYDQMPRNAIATGLADWVMPVRRMPEKLIFFRDSSERLHLTNGADPKKIAGEINAEDFLKEIITILRVRTGHDFANYKTPTLIRRIARHLQIHELEDLPTYLNFLRDSPEEVQFLQRNLLINVTNFFRDKEAFTALETEVIPKIFSGKTARDTVRVWSAGCASGEEAFSLAMLLSEYAGKQPDPPKFQIFATDVDDEAIQQAREHLYPEAIETDVSPERLKKFFVREGSRYRVKKELRETVLFAPHNILRDPPFSRLDLVVCRNLLIYVNRDAQERVLEIFHFALNAAGVLFLGTSESAENAVELFESVNKKHRIYRRRISAQIYSAPPKMPIAGSWQISAPETQKIAERVRAFSMGEVHYKLLENFAPPSVLVNQEFEIVYMSESIGRYLHFTGGKPSNNLLKLVKSDLLPDLRAALFVAQRERQSSEFPNVPATINGKETHVNLSIRVIDGEDSRSDFLLVIFDEAEQTKPLSAAERKKAANKKAVRAVGKDEAMAPVVRRLEDELQRTRSNLRATIEQHEISIEELKASNEELQAINEELRSATEELETSKEELHSVNEEMTTVNSELKDKMDEAAHSNADLQNLLASTDIATIFLDRKLQIKRYSPLVEKLFNIAPTDIGRPLEHFTHHLNYKNLTGDASEVLRNLKTLEREINDENGRVFLTRFAPYRTTDDRIEGVVLNFLEITKYKRAEEELQATRDEYRTQLEQEVEARTAELNENRDELERRSHVFEATLATITDFVYQFDREGRFTYVNQSLLDLWGLKEEEAIGKNFFQLGYPDELAEKLHRQIERVFADGENVRDETPYTSPTGAGGFFEYIFAPLKDADGAVRSVVGSTRDITARKKSEETSIRAAQSLRESEERLNLAASVSGFGVHDLDLLNNQLYWSPELKAMHGLAPDAEIDFANYNRYVHPDDRNRVEKAVQSALDPKGTGEFDEEFRIIRPDNGEILCLHNRSQTIFEGAGKNRRAVRNTGIVADLTSRIRAEEALRKSEESLRLVLESTQDYAIITFDLDHRVTRWNAGAERVFGYSENEMLGKTGEILFTPEDRANGVPEKEFAAALKKGRAEDERFHLRKDGSRFFVSGVTQPLKNGAVEGFVKIARDQTQKIEAEKNAQDKEMLRRLVAGQEEERKRLARDLHDHLGQQLTALRLRLEAAREICEEGDLCDAIKESERIVQRIDSDVSFLAWELRPSSLDDLGLVVALSDYLREWQFHTRIEAQFHASGLNVIKLLPEVETTIYRIAQEVLNNIYKHARAKKVSVIIKRQIGDVILIIEDDGIGFDVKKAKKVTGTKGLGLRGIGERAALVGGTVEIESKKKKGTTVFVRLPFSGLQEK